MRTCTCRQARSFPQASPAWFHMRRACPHDRHLCGLGQRAHPNVTQDPESGQQRFTNVRGSPSKERKAAHFCSAAESHTHISKPLLWPPRPPPWGYLGQADTPKSKQCSIFIAAIYGVNSKGGTAHGRGSNLWEISPNKVWVQSAGFLRYGQQSLRRLVAQSRTKVRGQRFRTAGAAGLCAPLQRHSQRVQQPLSVWGGLICLAYTPLQPHPPGHGQTWKDTLKRSKDNSEDLKRLQDDPED